MDVAPISYYVYPCYVLYCLMPVFPLATAMQYLRSTTTVSFGRGST